MNNEALRNPRPCFTEFKVSAEPTLGTIAVKNYNNSNKNILFSSSGVHTLRMTMSYSFQVGETM